MGDPVRMRLFYFGLDAPEIGRGGWSFEKREPLRARGWSEHPMLFRMFAPPYGDEVNKNTCGAAGASREKS